MSKYISTIGLLVLSNVFMTLAWYGHLKFFSKEGGHASTPLWTIILLSWGMAFFEYCYFILRYSKGQNSGGSSSGRL